jgi:hypothetical protein
VGRGSALAAGRSGRRTDENENENADAEARPLVIEMYVPKDGPPRHFQTQAQTQAQARGRQAMGGMPMASHEHSQGQAPR